jgi:hypothetical protein
MNATYIVKDVYEYEIIKDKIIEWMSNNLDSIVFIEIVYHGNKKLLTSNLREHYLEFKEMIDKNIATLLSVGDTTVAVKITDEYVFIMVVVYGDKEISLFFRKME